MEVKIFKWANVVEHCRHNTIMMNAFNDFYNQLSFCEWSIPSDILKSFRTADIIWNMKYKKIKNIKQYNEYCDMHEQLLMEDEVKYGDEIELLEVLIEDYDKRVIEDKLEQLNPVELLQSLIRDAGMTQKELAQKIGVSKQLISDILNYRRNISKEVSIKLADFFSMSQKAFGRVYELKENSTQTNF